MVRELDLPFRRAHHVTGEIVKLAEQKSCRLVDLKIEELKSIETSINEKIFDVLDPVKSVFSRVSFGGTAPGNVKKAAVEARKRFL